MSGESGKRARLGLLIGFIWFAIVVTAYYLTHKPVTPQIALSLARAFAQIVVSFTVLIIAGGMGTRILPAVDPNPLIRLSLQAALGLGVLAMGATLLGLVGAWHSLLAWVVLLVLAVVLRKAILTWLASWVDFRQVWSASGLLGRIIAVGTGILLLCTLVVCLAPPLKFDTLVYHFALPETYIQQKGLVYTSENIFWGMPQLGEMLYTWAMMLVGDAGALVLSWGFAALGLVGLWGHVSERFGPEVAWVSLASLLSGYTLSSSLSWGYVDGLVVYFGVCTLITLDRWTRSRDRGDLYLSGLYAGLAFSTKYTGGILWLCGLFMIAWFGRRDIEIKRLARQLLQFSGAFLLVISPWLLKNVLATGNPFYPLLFPAGAMDRFRLDFYQGSPPWGGWWDVFLLPVRATFYGIEGGPGYGASLGPLLLGLSPLAWLGWRSLPDDDRGIIRIATLLCLPALVVWIVAGRLSLYLSQSRLYFAVFPAVAVLAGAGYRNLSQFAWAGVRFYRLTGILIVLVLGLNVIQVGIDTLRQGAPQYLIGQKTSESYLVDNLGWYAPAMAAIGELPAESRVLMLWEPRSAYCLPRCDPDEIIDRWIHDRYRHGTSSEILQSWREAGYSHLLFHQAGAEFVRGDDERYQLADWAALEELRGQLPEPVQFGDAYSLYSLSQ